jgi:hypothetical protein
VLVGLSPEAPSLAAFSLNRQKSQPLGTFALIPFIAALSGYPRLVIWNSTPEPICDVSRKILQNFPD